MDLSLREGRREQGLRIQSAVEKAGLSIEEIAGRIGCSRALIYQYLSGSTLAQPDRLQRIAEECGVSLASFYEASPLEPTLPVTDAAAPLPSLTNPAPPLSYELLSALADAQESPPDYRALAATCERMLAYATQQNDTTATVRALKRLGNARYFLADYPRAIESLSRAVTLAAETGDSPTETASRQTLGGALLATGRISEARKQFTLIAENESVPSARWKGVVSLGSIHEMQGEYRRAMERFDEAATLLDSARAADEMTEEAAIYGRLYVDGNRRYVYMDEGDFAEARRLAEACAATAEAIGNPDQHLEARFDRAWCDFHTGAWTNAFADWQATLQLARFVGDANRETICRAWLGIFSAAAGNLDAAIEYGKDALSAALSRGDRRAEFYAQLALTDAYTASGERGSEARYHVNQALAIATALKQERNEIECRLRMARLAHAEGELAELEDAAARAFSLSERLGAQHLKALAQVWQREASRLKPLENGSSPTEEKTMVTEDFIEVRWRATAQSGDFPEAIRLLEGLRQQLRAAGQEDTLLEVRDIFAVYLTYAERLTAQNPPQSTPEIRTRFLEETGWLPLSQRFSTE